MYPFESLRRQVVDSAYLLILILTQLMVSNLLLITFPFIALSKILRPSSPRPLSTSKNTFFITGASSGIGAGLAVALASEPNTAAIYLSGRSRERLEATRRACLAVASKSSLRLPMIVADVCDEALMRRELLAADANEIEEGCGGLTCIVANAGVSAAQVQLGNDHDGFKTSAQILDINLMGTIHTIVPIVPVFSKRRRGQIVIMSSLASFTPGITWTTAYAASKGGQRYYGESLRVGLEGFGVDVLTVCPGLVETAMTSKLKGSMSMLKVQDTVKEIVKAMKLGGVGTLCIPRAHGLFASSFNMLPVDVRYLIGRVVHSRRFVKDYLSGPN